MPTCRRQEDCQEFQPNLDCRVGTCLKHYKNSAQRRPVACAAQPHWKPCPSHAFACPHPHVLLHTGSLVSTAQILLRAPGSPSSTVLQLWSGTEAPLPRCPCRTAGQSWGPASPCLHLTSSMLRAKLSRPSLHSPAFPCWVGAPLDRLSPSSVFLLS